MPSTYTKNQGLEKPGTGEQAGIWGNTANADFDFIDAALDGGLTVSLAAPSYDIITNPGANSEGRNRVLTFTGTLSQDATISIKPATAQKVYFVRNATSGGFSLVFQQGTGTQYKVKAGQSAVIFANGLGAAAGVSGLLANLQVDNLLVTTALISSSLATFSAGVTASAPVTLNLGSDAASDLYYRSAAGPLARLGIGGVGTALTVGAGSTLQWASVSPAIGIPVTGGTAGCVLFVDDALKLAQSGVFRFSVAAGGLGIGTDTPGYTLHVGVAYYAQICLDAKASPANHRLLFTSTNTTGPPTTTPRAQLRLAGDTSYNLILSTYNDALTVENIHLAGTRNGHTTIGAYIDMGATLGVYCPRNEPAFVVRGGGSFVQAWQDSGGNQISTLNNAGNLDVKGGYYVSGVPLQLGQPQTPWATDIDANNKSLSNCAWVGGTNGGPGVLRVNNTNAGTTPNGGLYFYTTGNNLWVFVRTLGGTGINIMLG